jgi:hypothetical protein
VATSGLKRLLLAALIASLCVTGGIAIGILLFGSFDDTSWRILGTTALIGGFSLAILPAGILLDRGRATTLAWTVIALSAAALAGVLGLIWEVVRDSEVVGKTVGVITVAALAGSQTAATTGLRRPSDTSVVTRLYLASIATAAALATLILILILAEIEDNGSFFRALGAVAVLNVLVVILQPAVRRFAAQPAAQAVNAAPAVHRFRCSLDRLPDALPDPERYRAAAEGMPSVVCRIPAANFADAVAAAIRELESTGVRILRIERNGSGAEG